MASSKEGLGVAAELKALKHEMKNQKMKNLPANMTVQRRPLFHAPVASPHAGVNVQKVVYISSHTPLMSAIKRVRKLLCNVEKRAIQSVDATDQRSARATADLAAVSDHLVRSNEEILVKASGRAMQQALRVGEWFRTKEKEMVCKVEVRAGSVQAIDDIVEIDSSLDTDGDADQHEESHDAEQGETTILEGGDTTLELLGTANDSDRKGNLPTKPVLGTQADIQAPTGPSTRKKKRSRRKRAKYEDNDVPEARLRWVKTVEVAISFKS